MTETPQGPAASIPDSALGTLAATLASTSYDTIGDAVAACARQRLFDTLGAAALGLRTPEGQLLKKLDEHRRGIAPSAMNRCRLYVGATRTTEIDDIDIASCTTVGSVVVPVAMAIAAAQPHLDGRCLLTGIVAGYEAMIRLGRAIGGARLLYRGVWPTYVTAAFAAAATTAKVLGLDARHTAAALALALSRSSVVAPAALARFGFRYYALGSAAAEGCAAAIAARAGVEADEKSLGRFCDRIGATLDAAEMLEGLGSEWKIREVDTKMLPSSRQALASIEAFMRHTPLAGPIDEIETIAVYVPAEYRSMIDRPNLPAQRIDSMIGVQYAMALVALDPDGLYDALRPSLRSSEPIAQFMAKVAVHADADLGARFPHTWGSRVIVRWRSGETTTIEVLEPFGSGGHELDWSAIERKLERIFEASGVRAATATLSARCQMVGQRPDPGAAAELFALAETLSSSTEPCNPAELTGHGGQR